uniref:Ribosomal protein L39 n=1 Tax=Suricata suricatta TaxID=37032 RepID=A0A673V5J5_SURSU
MFPGSWRGLLRRRTHSALASPETSKLLSFPPPLWCGRLAVLSVSSHETFRIKQPLAKKQKQNHPISQWIQTKTGNKTRYSSKRRDWRRTKLHLQGVAPETAHTFMLHEGRVSYPVTL